MKCHGLPFPHVVCIAAVTTFSVDICACLQKICCEMPVNYSRAFKKESRSERVFLYFFPCMLAAQYADEVIVLLLKPHTLLLFTSRMKSLWAPVLEISHITLLTLGHTDQQQPHSWNCSSNRTMRRRVIGLTDVIYLDKCMSMWGLVWALTYCQNSSSSEKPKFKLKLMAKSGELYQTLLVCENRHKDQR